MIFFGWGKGSKKMCDVYFGECSQCHNMVIFELRQFAKKFELYFIPVVRWDKQYYISCPKCSYGYEVLKEKVEDIKEIGRKMPDSRLIFESWRDVINYHTNNFADFVKNKPNEDYITNLIGHLRKLGYERDVIDYILPIFARQVTEAIESICPKCGADLEKNSNFCKKCGANIKSSFPEKAKEGLIEDRPKSTE